jgi:hypothetical protein
LPLQSAGLLAQAKISAAQGDLETSQMLKTQAQNRLDKAFELQTNYETALFNWKQDLADKVMEYADARQKEALDQKKIENDRAYQEKKDILSTINNLAQQYPDAAISPTDTLEQAQKKAARSPSFLADQKTASSGGADGLTPAQMNSTINSIAQTFDNEQIVKSYNIAQEGYQTVNSIGTKTTSPADDIAFIYAFAKIMDPNSVVREGEYNTIQKYAQTWADNFGFTAKRIFSNTNFLSSDAKQKMLNALKPKINTLSAQYKNLQDEYNRRIEEVKGGGYNTLPDYSKAFTSTTTAPTTTDEQADQILKEVGGTTTQKTEKPSLWNSILSFFK